MQQDWSKPVNLVSTGWRKQMQKRRRGCYRRIGGCLILLLLLVFGCGWLFWFVQGSQAAPLQQEYEPKPLAIYLLIDNSQSMFDLAGVGSDPELLRIDAARLFISYLGVDSTQTINQCGVIFFGTEAEAVVPLTPLANDDQRAEMLTQIQSPPMMGWTDQTQALEMARQALQPMADTNQPVIVLLTDGKPQWNESPTIEETKAYRSQLRELGATLAENGIPVFIILLANDATDRDDAIATQWTPLWQEIASDTQPGRFYEARRPQDLVDIYHDIAVALLDGQTAGPILQAEVGAGGIRQTVVVEPQLERLTLVISKSNPALTVTILQPDGTPLMADASQVRRAGGNGRTPEEVWVIDFPTPGDWTVLISGEGRVTVWKDYRLLPSHTPQPIITIRASHTPESSPTPTLIPTLKATAIVPAPLMPTSVPPKTPLASMSPEPSRSPFGVWLIGLLILVGSLAGGYRYWQRQQPYILGTLELVSGPGFLSGEQSIVLDTWRQSSLQLGSDGDLALVEAGPACFLHVSVPVGNTHEVVITGEILVNDKPIVSEHALHDGDIIMLGQTRLQYTNLRLRTAQEEMLNRWQKPDLAF